MNLANYRKTAEAVSYLQAYVTGFRSFISSRHIMIYVVIFFIFVFRQRHKGQTPEINAIIVICLLYASAHFALFPAYEDRFFAFPASLLFLSLIVLLFSGGSASPARQVRRVKALSSV
jgi:hypothetical protein